MEDLTLVLEKREVTGKAVKRLRYEGKVPAVIHDHGKESIIVAGDYQHIMKTYMAAGKHHPITVKTGAQTYTALIKNITFDPRKNSITHVVFNAVKANEKVVTDIPVRIKFDEGNDSSPAERASLIVLHQLETVEVEAFPKNLPDFLEFNGEMLVAVGDHATVADLIVPEGVEVKADPTQTLATVFEPSALQAANDAVGGTAEPDEEVESEQGSDDTEEITQEPEDRPGGKKQFEDKGE
jgi:large subunit ribosomal protein L25